MHAHKERGLQREFVDEKSIKMYESIMKWSRLSADIKNLWQEEVIKSNWQAVSLVGRQVISEACRLTHNQPTPRDQKLGLLCWQTVDFGP